MTASKWPTLTWVTRQFLYVLRRLDLLSKQEFHSLNMFLYHMSVEDLKKYLERWKLNEDR